MKFGPVVNNRVEEGGLKGVAVFVERHIVQIETLTPPPYTDPMIPTFT